MMRRVGLLFLGAGVFFGGFIFEIVFAAKEPRQIVVGSKTFTESYILGEIAAQALEQSQSNQENEDSVRIVRKIGLGSTGIIFESITNGVIDVYPDYTGTLAEAILKNPTLKGHGAIERELAKQGLMISRPLGFNNTYALAVTESFAKQHDLHTMSDLTRVIPDIKAAFSYEFMDRVDGYKGMSARYRFRIPAANIARMEHSLTYPAIEDGAVNLIEVYSTDAKIKKLSLRVLTDDLGYFPTYEAVWVARKSFVEQHPKFWDALRKLENTISQEKIRDLNAQADLDKVSFSTIASRFLGVPAHKADSRFSDLIRRTNQHLRLVGVALLFSLLVGIPLGLIAARYKLAGQTILLASGLFQTIPSLALLCFLIPVFGVGTTPALVALCLYSLLPVVMNTVIGVRSIEKKHLENARAYGLNRWQILSRIVIPLASPTILAGVKTATIVTIGTATLAALIGAGGYGVPIVAGLALNDVPTILTGAVPAAGMALCAYVIFDVVERFILPAGLRRR